MQKQRQDSRNSRSLKDGKNKYIWLFLLCLCLIGTVVSLGIAGYRKVREKRAAEEFENLAKLAVGDTLKPSEEAEDSLGVTGQGAAGNGVQAEVSGKDSQGEPTALERDLIFMEEQEIPIPDKYIDFAGLQEGTNEDIYAWIYVPDTKIDYPVLQHGTDNTYYLNYNIDGSRGYPGCIYTENYNSKDFTDFNTVLYGHNMKDGSMFANLHKFEDAEFFEGHPYVYVYTEERLLVYEVFAAYEFSSAHLLKKYNMESEMGISTYLEEIKSVRDMGRNIREDIFPDAQKHMITLSTCIKNKPDNRYLVQGVLLNED